MEATRPQTFGTLLRRFRKEAGLTQEELAERAGMSVRGISDLERGVSRAPYRATVQFLADALQLSADDRAALEAAAKRHAGPASEAASISPLPSEPTPLLGREREEAQGISFLRSGTRLLTLTGPGGVGKTRLAVRIASSVAGDFSHGVVFVPLATIRDPSLVPSTIAKETRKRVPAEEEASVRAPREAPLPDSLRAFLQQRELLLVLDNFEQVVEAAPLIAGLLEAAPGLKVLVTSRAPLRLRGEQEMQVPPLAFPELGQVPAAADIARYPAIALFLQRARAVKPDFQITDANAASTAEICRRLDGLPLAIELAAARIKVLPPRTLLERLEHPLRLLTGGPRDLPERQQTMRDTIAWSYNLLETREQELFRRLAVFVGGWTIEAAEAACLSRIDHPFDVLESLASLVDQGLAIVSGEDNRTLRFGMLETIREYALERLAHSGEEPELRQAHAGYYLALAEEAEPELLGPDQMAWFSRLEEEHDNLRQALGWLLRCADMTSALRLAASLWRFWMTRGHLAEGAKWLEQALGDEGASASLRAKGLHGAAVIAFHRGEQMRATSLLGESLRLFRELGDIRGVAQVLAELAYIANDRGEYNRSASLYTEALGLFRNLEERTRFAQTLNDLANVRLNQEEYDLARGLYTQALSLSRELGDTRAIAIALNNLGSVAEREGEYEQAINLFAESLELRRALGDQPGIALSLVNLAVVTWLDGSCERAASLLADGLRLSHRLGDNRVTLFCLVTLAGIVATQGKTERAARLWSAGEALGAAMGIAIPPSVLAEYHKRLTVPRSRLGEDFWRAACERGRAMTLDQAVAYALEEE
jgi:predicted ATPase/DNA-binding XRE family transcriptional regulator